jgi:hypothetical protein
MDIVTMQHELAAAKAALAAKEQEVADSKDAVPKGALHPCDTFTGDERQKFPDWHASWEAYQTALGTSKSQWAQVFLTFIMGPAMVFLRAKFGDKLSATPYPELVQALETAQLGHHETDYTLCDSMLKMPLKRKGDQYMVSQYVHDFENKRLQCKVAPDSVTACWMFLRSLPASLQSGVATDAAGQPWTSLEALRNYVLAVADAWERDSANQVLPSGAPLNRNPPKKPRYQEARSATAADHSSKPSFVPGRTPQELNALRKRNACFKCGKPGHRAAQCKASASKSS